MTCSFCVDVDVTAFTLAYILPINNICANNCYCTNTITRPIRWVLRASLVGLPLLRTASSYYILSLARSLSYWFNGACLGLAAWGYRTHLSRYQQITRACMTKSSILSHNSIVKCQKIRKTRSCISHPTALSEQFFWHAGLDGQGSSVQSQEPLCDK